MNFRRPLNLKIIGRRFYSTICLSLLISSFFILPSHTIEHKEIHYDKSGVTSEFLETNIPKHKAACDPDTEPPTILCPHAVNINCGEDLNPFTNPDLGIAKAIDNCDDEPVITFFDTGRPNFCEAGSFTRIWKAVDKSGNEVNCEQVIIMEPDRTPPTIMFDPEEVGAVPNDTIELTCGELSDLVDLLELAIATDNCTEVPKVFFEEIPSSNPSCIPGYPETLDCIWYAVDDCGNESEKLILTMRIIDREAPQLFCLPSRNISCGQSLDPAINESIGYPEYTENCDPNPQFRYTDAGEYDICEGGQIRRLWVIEDACGNQDSCVQLLNILPDTEAPIIVFNEEYRDTFIEGVLTIDWSQGLPDFTDMPNWVDATDNCGDVDLVFEDIVANIDCTEFGYFKRYICTWQAFDACGNASNKIEVELRITDLVAPEINCPANVLVTCIADFNPYINPTLGIATGEDDCDENPIIDYTDGSGFSFCGRDTLVRTWTIIDACQNETSCEQLIILLPDDTPPTIIECPENIVLECNPTSLPVPAPNAIKATDNCRGPGFEFGGHHYLLTSGSGDWESMRAEALSKGGDLVAINTLSEQNFLAQHFGSASYWIGYTDAAIEGTWVWSNGDPSGYTNWAPGEPNESPPSEDFAILDVEESSQWNDWGVARPDFPIGGIRGIIEIPEKNLISVSVDTIQHDTIDCRGILQYRYNVMDYCGNTSSCIQTISYTVDTQAPIILDCPEDIFLACNPGELPNPVNVDAEDDCGIAETRFSTREFKDGCLIIIEREWIVVDNCGNESDPCIQYIEYTEDKNPPILLDCPVNMNLGCNPSEIPEPPVLRAEDMCLNAAIDFSEALESDGCDYLLTRTWTAVDDCGNTSIQCSQQISYQIDTIAPVILSCPADLDLGCNPATIPAPPSVEAADDCGVSEIMFSSTKTTDGCYRTITNTWVAMDFCGNASDTCTQIIKYTIDKTPPRINCPVGEDLGCNPEIFPEPSQIQIIDNCKGPGIEYNGKFYVPTPRRGNWEEARTMALEMGGDLVAINDAAEQAFIDEAFEQNGMLWSGYNDVAMEGTWVWSNGDSSEYENWDAGEPNDANNGEDYGILNWRGTKKWNDATLTIPKDAEGNPEEGLFGLVELSFNAYYGVEVFSINSINGCNGTLEYIYVASDFCGNETSCTQTYTYTIDTEAPLFLGCPADIDLGCNPLEIPEPISPIAIDGCTGFPSISFDESFSSEGCIETITRTWIAIDACGNVSEPCVQVITYEVVEGSPEFACPEGGDLGCNPEELPEPATSIDQVFTSCNNSIVEFEGHYYQISNTSGSWNETRAEAIQKGGELVAINSAAEQAFLEAEFGASGILWIGYFDSSSEGTFIWSNGEPTTYQNWAPGEPNDFVSPGIGEDFVVFNWDNPGLWNDWSVLSGFFPINGIPAIIEYSSNPNDLEVVTLRNDTIGCVGTLVYQYTVTDHCGQSNSCSQTYTYSVDNTPPAITNCPSDINLGWNPSTIPAPPIIQADDNCGIAELTMTVDTIGDDCDLYILRTWVAIDSCGNESAPCTQKLYYQIDTEAPVIACPTDLDLACNPASIPPFIKPSVSDNCSDDITLTGTERFLETEDICQYALERTWIAMDQCGNADTCVQVIRYTIDTIPPVIICEASIDLGCNPDSIPAIVEPEITDLCGIREIRLEENTITEGCVTTITRTWLAFDNCNNFSRCDQTITWIDDTEAPTFEVITEEVTVQCRYDDPNWSPMDIDLEDVVLINDACTAVTIEVTDQLIESGNCLETGIMERWVCNLTATDACGNDTMFTFFVNVIDTIPPTISIDEELDITASCDSIPVPATPSAMDNCSVIISFREVIENAICTGAYDLFRIWTATDDCGNSSSITQRIRVFDDKAPTLKFTGRLEKERDNGEVLLDCQDLDSYLLNASVTAMDFCDSNPVIDLQTIEDKFDRCTEDGYAKIVRLIWTATDDCGNTASIRIHFVLTDITPPLLVGIPNDTCVQSLPPTPVIKAVDECNSHNLLVSMEENGPFLCADGGLYYERKWKAIDLCGNESEAKQKITISDGIPPVVSVSHLEFGDLFDGDTIRVEPNACTVPNVLEDLKIIAFDACSDQVTQDVSFDSVGTGLNSNGVLVNWFIAIISAKDLCGNEGTLSFIIEIESCGQFLPNGSTEIFDQLTNQPTSPDIQLFPNPTRDQVSIDFGNLAGKTGRMDIYNTLGQFMQERAFERFPDEAVQIDLQGYTSGIYLVIVTDNFGGRTSYQLIVH